MKSRCIYVNKILKLALKALGRHVARRPSLFIIFSCVLTIILGMGIIVSKYEPLSPEFTTVKYGKYEQSRKMLETLFPSNVSKNYNPARISRLSDGPIIFIVSKNGSSMISKPIFQEIDRVDRIVRGFSIETASGSLNYEKVCAREYGACFGNPIFKLMPKIDDIIAGKYRFKYPVDIVLRRMEVTPYVLSLGGVVVDGEGYVEDFVAVRLLYFADPKDSVERSYLRQWEYGIADQLQSEMFENIRVYTVAFAKVVDDISETNKYLLRFTSIVILSVIVFSMIALITKSRVRSKPWLGVAAGASAALALVSAYGTMFYAGVHNTDLTLFVAFVVLGTEVDDAYIMVASWRSTDPKDTVEERIARTYSEAAVSVTVSSLTSFVAYCVGIATPIDIVSKICLQCAVSILFTYFYQLLFFGPFMAVDGYREETRRNAFLFCKTSPDEGKGNKSVEKTSDDDENKDTVMKSMRDVLGGLLQFPACKVICLILFAANIIVAGFFVARLKSGSEVVDVLREGSDLEMSLEILLTHFKKYEHPINIVINQTLNYWDKDVQESVANMLKSFEDLPNIAEPNVTISWLKFYLEFANHPLVKSTLMSDDISKKENFMHGLRRIFLRIKLARQFLDDINFNEDYTEITSTRYIVFGSNLTNVDDEVRLMKDVENVIQKSKLPIKIFSTLFIQAEQATVIGKITMQTIWITTLLMFVIFLVFVANFPHAILVALCVTSSMVGTLGFMSAWGIRLDIVSLIVIVTCLGFSINYSAHMSYSFTTSQAGTPDEKMKESIYRVGLPVVQGAVSTVIAVLILGLQEIHIYVASFKVIFLTVMETTFHALLVLPVILSLFDLCMAATLKRKEKNEKNIPCTNVVESYHL